jgi:hypothetical protein
MKIRVYLIAAIAVAPLAACHGSATSPVLPISRESSSRAMTTAWGIVVDDPSGRPLSKRGRSESVAVT